MRKYFLFCLAISFAVALSVNLSAKETTFRTSGYWEQPPAFSGNPYIPRGSTTSKDFVFGKLALYEPLTGNYKNYLAESFKEEGLKFTVKIKDGIFWDDGVPFTSQDIKTHFIVWGAGKGALMGIWHSLGSIDIPDDHTIVFNFDKNEVDFIPELLQKMILDEVITGAHHIFENWIDKSEEILKLRKVKPGTEGFEEASEKSLKMEEELIVDLQSYNPKIPLGYGPFKVVNVTPSAMLLEKVEKYPGIENCKIDRVILDRSRTNNVMWGDLRAGTFDFVSIATPPDTVESIMNANKNIEAVSVSSFETKSLYINNKNTPLNDYKFRQALGYIIDRDKVRELANYYGTTSDITSGLLPSIRKQWIDDTKLNPYNKDLEKAEDLLLEIGMKKNDKGMWCDKDGKELNLKLVTVAEFNDFTMAADEISRQLKSFGIEVNIKQFPFNMFFTQLSEGNYDLAIMFGLNARWHPIQGYSTLFGYQNWGQQLGHIDYRLVPDKGVYDLEGLSKYYKYKEGDEKIEPGILALDKLVGAIAETKDKAEQKEIISALAMATNQYLQQIDLFEGSAQYFINSERIKGWPTGKDLEVFLTSVPTYYIVTLMLDGTLHG